MTDIAGYRRPHKGTQPEYLHPAYVSTRKRAPSKPLQLHTGLAGGIGDRINDALLSFVNDANAEAEAFFNQADARGIFWST